MATISIDSLTKRFGRLTAVDGLTFEAPPGQITGFLGPNGAGKTTTLRSLLGLVRPTSGLAVIDGRRYQDLRQPRRVVGAMLESGSSRPGRSGADHLRVIANTAGVGETRVSEVLDMVGLTRAADRRVSGYSLGMRQRLGLAGALLGDPEVLILDEPANGLDPEGIAWLRSLLQGLAAEGRTVLISSHLLSEVAQTVDRVVIIDRGELRFAGSLAELGSGSGSVSVRAVQLDRLRGALVSAGFAVSGETESLDVAGATVEQVGRIAAAEQIVLTGLTAEGASLEAAFLRLTSSDDAPPSPRLRRPSARPASRPTN
jgi:ABC-2 type transport system ATP-binding protein